MPSSDWHAQMGVFQTTLAGVLDAGEGRREPAALYLYLKGMRHAEVIHLAWAGALPRQSDL